jgi:RND family efflux transporter MFP subunit
LQQLTKERPISSTRPTRRAEPWASRPAVNEPAGAFHRSVTSVRRVRLNRPAVFPVDSGYTEFFGGFAGSSLSIAAVQNLKEDLASLRIEHSARAGGRGRGVWVTVAVLLVAVAAGGWFWMNGVEAATVKTAPVAATSNSPSAPGAVLNASGYVTARRHATVSSKVTGKVLEIFVEEGKAVHRGQILARLDDSQVRSALDVAQAQLDSARHAAAEDEARLHEAELNLQRQSSLVTQGVIGRAELDAAQAQVDSLKARIVLAQKQVTVAESQVNARRTDLADMVVRAPFDGVAISKDAQPGEMISPISAGGGFTRTGICTIVDMSSLEIEVDVNEAYIHRVHPGQPVEAVLDAYPDWRIPAHVITTVPSADRQKATVKVRIGFQKLDPRILPDMGVKVSFLAEPTADNAVSATRARLLVPKTAVRSVDGRDVVFVVKDGRAERRAVKVGQADGDQVEVTSGLLSGERVVVDGPATLADGARVKER